MSGTRDLRQGLLSTYVGGLKPAGAGQIHFSRSMMDLKGAKISVKSVHTAAGATDAGKAVKSTKNISVTDKSIIAVMGGTGSGKSSFIKGVTGREDIIIGHTLHSETEEIQTYDVKHGDATFVLADTPGFDDTNRSDFDVLHQISDWLKCNFDAGKRLTGIIYLHPITSTRLQGSSLRTMSLFNKLCGEGNQHNIILVTTFWNAVQKHTGEAREKELGEIDSMWKSMKSSGSRVERMARDYDRFKPLLAQMSKKGGMKMQITEELRQGKTLEETMAGLALITDDAKLKEVQDSYQRKLAERRRRAEKQRREAAAKLAEAQKAELAFKAAEDAKLAARLREVQQEHERKKKAREAEIEKNKKKAKELEAQQQQWRKQEEERAIRTHLHGAAKTHFRASEILKSNVESSIDMFRAIYAAGGTRVQVKGVSARGIGFSTVDAQGRRGRGWSVDRSSLNIWCDACMTPIGARGVFRCTKCVPGRDLSYCKSCHADGYGCLDRSHKLVMDTRLLSGTCRRELNPANSLDCSRLDCRKQIQGLYLHCCECDNDDFDICMECVLMKGRGCRNANHNLKWAVLPVGLPEPIYQELERIAQMGKFPLQDYMVFNNAEAAELCKFSKDQMDFLLNQLTMIENGVREGDVKVQIGEYTIPGWCDACMVMNGAFPTYSCDQHHDPFPPGLNFLLCKNCRNSGRKCPGGNAHQLKYEAAPTSKCSRMNEQIQGNVTCDVQECRKDIKGLYVHCCICSSDDMDICVDCIMNGWACGDTGHSLKLYFTRPFGAPG